MQFDPDQAIVIANPRAAGGRVAKRWDAISSLIREVLGDIDIQQTSGPSHASELARRALWAGKRWVLSLGGDGTHSEVVAGVVRASPDPKQAIVGILPYGSGGDFARMLEGTRELRASLERIKTEEPAPIDVGTVEALGPEGKTEQRLFINECSVGLSGEVCRRVNQSNKPLGGTATYYAASLAGTVNHEAPTVRLIVDGQPQEDLEISLIMVANGRYAGGGMLFAPTAQVSDGMLDVVVVQQGTFFEMLRFSPSLYLGKVLQHPKVRHFRCNRVRIESLLPGSDLVEVDGDPIGNLPMEAGILPGAVQIIGLRREVL